MNELFENERRNAISRTMVALFVARSNRPCTINDLHDAYAVMKGGIEVRRESPPKDRTSSVRSYISQWNKLAKANQIPLHRPGADGCSQTVHHRICKKKVSKVGNMYWLYDGLYQNVKRDQELSSPCHRSKRAHRKGRMIVSGRPSTIPPDSPPLSPIQPYIPPPNTSLPKSSDDLESYDWNTVYPELTFVGIMPDVCLNGSNAPVVVEQSTKKEDTKDQGLDWDSYIDEMDEEGGAFESDDLFENFFNDVLIDDIQKFNTWDTMDLDTVLHTVDDTLNSDDDTLDFPDESAESDSDLDFPDDISNDSSSSQISLNDVLDYVCE